VAAWATRVVIMDEPTAALGVRETRQVLDLIRRVRDNGLPVVLISHNMPDVFAVADRIHIHRLGRRVALVEASSLTMDDAVAVMTGARSAETLAQVRVPDPAGHRTNLADAITTPGENR
jgi:fructose transport system ATP-binding protein